MIKRLAALMIAANIALFGQDVIDTMNATLNKYKIFLEEGTYGGQDWSSFAIKPKSRFESFKLVFEHFVRHNGKVIVELGTTRSFTHGGLPGCNQNDPRHWTPDKPENWDWGAGSFTRMAAECLSHVVPEIHTVDIETAHLNRCKVVTAPFAHIMHYHLNSSLTFLRTCEFKNGIDLIYLDTGDMTPIEPTAKLQLMEAKIIVERDLLAKDGLILIDDVRNQTPKLFGDLSGLGKSKYSLPYLLEHGFEVVADEYQVVLRKANKEEKSC